MKGDVMDVLNTESLRFKSLINHWSSIYAEAEKIPTVSGSDNRFEFNLFGSECYGKFIHNFEKGAVEYGFVDNEKDDKRGMLSFNMDGSFTSISDGIANPVPCHLMRGDGVRMIEDLLMALAEEIKQIEIN